MADAVQFEASARTSAAEPSAGAKTATRTRLVAIDALRGLVMLFMLVDHVREAFYAQHAVTDPMDPLLIEPALFFTRITSQICAPVFVALTGIAAYLYGRSHSRKETSLFLIKRGLFLVLLEVAVVSQAWAVQKFPPTFWLQVIWAIGICMIALAGLLYRPRVWQIALGAIIVCGHNLLDGITVSAHSPFFVLWAFLHQRAAFDVGAGITVKISYPVLPWIGVILLGYAIGPWFARETDIAQRNKRLRAWGAALIGAFLVLRLVNIYGDQPWFYTGDALRTAMSFLTLTKYPPSLLFLMPTLGIGMILLTWFEAWQAKRSMARLAVLGGAPMFFYIGHLYTIKGLYFSGLAIWGLNQGHAFGVEHVYGIWLISLALAVPLYFPTAWFARLKQRRRDLKWLSYL